MRRQLHGLMQWARRAARGGVAALLLTLAWGAAGCAVGGFLASAVYPDEYKVKVDAQYTKLENQKVAVIVAVPDIMRSRYPSAQTLLCRSISKEIRENVPGVVVVDPDQLVAWQNRTPYWTALSYGELIDKINVDRVVLVDVGEYTMYEPGNQNVMQGVIVANINVIEEGQQINGGSGQGLAFQHRIESRFPEGRPVGLLDMDEESMEFATVKKFAVETGWVFYNHTEERRR